jgi:hypothetical protein
MSTDHNPPHRSGVGVVSSGNRIEAATVNDQRMIGGGGVRWRATGCGHGCPGGGGRTARRTGPASRTGWAARRSPAARTARQGRPPGGGARGASVERGRHGSPGPRGDGRGATPGAAARRHARPLRAATSAQRSRITRLAGVPAAAAVRAQPVGQPQVGGLGSSLQRRHGLRAAVRALGPGCSRSDARPAAGRRRRRLARQVRGRRRVAVAPRAGRQGRGATRRTWGRDGDAAGARGGSRTGAHASVSRAAA